MNTTIQVHPLQKRFPSPVSRFQEVESCYWVNSAPICPDTVTMETHTQNGEVAIKWHIIMLTCHSKT